MYASLFFWSLRFSELFLFFGEFTMLFVSLFFVLPQTPAILLQPYRYKKPPAPGITSERGLLMQLGDYT